MNVFKQKYGFVVAQLLALSAVQAQHDTNVTYGLKLGALRSTISNLPEVIIGRNDAFQNFSLESKGSYGVEGGFFMNCKLTDSRVAIQPELLYRTAGERVVYKDVLGKEYELSLNYTYLVLGAMYKAYPFKGLNIGVGAFYGFNLSSNDLEYQSNEQNGLNDVTVRQSFRDGIKGADDLSISFGLGYELEKSVHFDVRYYFGVSDVIKSGQSTFEYIENKNRTQILSFSIGYSLHQW